VFRLVRAAWQLQCQGAVAAVEHKHRGTRKTKVSGTSFRCSRWGAAGVVAWAERTVRSWLLEATGHRCQTVQSPGSVLQTRLASTALTTTHGSSHGPMLKVFISCFFVSWVLGLCGHGTCSFVILNLLAGMFFLWSATAEASHLKRDVLVIAMLENFRMSAGLGVL
jgi:hypothetical protein